MPFVGLDTILHVKATAGASYVRPGRVDDATLEADQSYNHQTGAGGDDSGVYGAIAPKGNASMWVQNTTMLTNCLRTVINGLPPAVAEIQGGALGGGLKKQTTCYANTWELSLEHEGALKMDFSWLALAHTAGDITTAAAALEKNLLLVWYGAAVTLAGNAYDAKSIRISGENGLEHSYDLDAKASGSERLPTAIRPGDQQISVEIEFGAPPTVDLGVATPATVQLVFSAKNTAATVGTFLATVSNLHGTNLPYVVKTGADEVTWRFTAELDYNDLTSFTYGLV